METIVRSIRDINSVDRHALEHVIGQQLRENQQVIIQVKTVGEMSGDTTPSQKTAGSAAALPPWCNVFDGLSDKEVEEIEAVILDRDHWTRTTD